MMPSNGNGNRKLCRTASDIAKHSATARLLGDSLQQVDAAISIARATPK